MRLSISTALRGLFLSLVLALCVTVKPPLYADRHSEAEVKKYLGDVESELSDIVRTGAENYAAREIKRALDHVASAKKLLGEDERDLAYYELKKAAAHFRLVEARRLMVHAELDFEQSKKSAEK